VGRGQNNPSCFGISTGIDSRTRSLLRPPRHATREAPDAHSDDALAMDEAEDRVELELV
jgi:hypothetical protein